MAGHMPVANTQYSPYAMNAAKDAFSRTESLGPTFGLVDQNQRAEMLLTQQRNGYRPNAQNSAVPGGQRPPTNQHNVQTARRESRLEHWTFTKYVGTGVEPAWRVSERHQDHIAQSELKERVEKHRKRHGSAKEQLNASDMAGNKQKQVTRLEKDRNILDVDARYEWIIKYIKLEKEKGKTTPTKAMRVIIERKSTKSLRQVRRADSPFPWKSVVNVEDPDSLSRNLYDETRGYPTQGLFRHLSTDPRTMPNPGPTQIHQGQQLGAQTQRVDPINSAFTAKAAMPQERQEPRRPEKQEFVDRKNSNHNPPKVAQHDHGKSRPPTGKRTPEIIPISSEDDEVSSAAHSDSDWSPSDNSTIDTVYSHETRGSGKAPASPKSPMGRKSKSYPKFENTRKGHHGDSPSIRHHERPRAHNIPSSESDSHHSSDEAEMYLNRNSGRHRGGSPHSSKPRHHKRQVKTPYIRQHERPKARDMSPARYEPRTVEIQPGKSRKGRRESMHSRGSSHDSRLHELRLGSSYDLPHAFNFAQRRVQGLEQVEKSREREYSIPKYYETPEIAERERRLHERELEFEVRVLNRRLSGIEDDIRRRVY